MTVWVGPESKPAVKKFWTIWTKGGSCSFHGKRHVAHDLQFWWLDRIINKELGWVNANYNAMHLHSLACKNKTENDSRLLKNSKGNHDGEWNFCREKEAVSLAISWFQNFSQNFVWLVSVCVVPLLLAVMINLWKWWVS